jgi:hypothetical protein
VERDTADHPSPLSAAICSLIQSYWQPLLYCPEWDAIIIESITGVSDDEVHWV